MNPPRITIITPTFNSASTLERSLRSVTEQRYPNLQHVAIDGGSTDGTLDILRAYEAHGLAWRSEKDAGIADAFNKGVARADGDLIGIINSDDEYEPGALHAVADLYARLPPGRAASTIIHGDMLWIHAGVTRLVKPRRWGGRDGVGVARFFDMPVNHPACFVPRAVYDRVGKFDTSYRLCMDYQWVLRAFAAGVRFEYLPRPLARFHVGGVSTTHTRKALAEVYRAQRSVGLSAALCLPAYAGKLIVNWVKAVTGLRLPPGRGHG